MKIECTFKRRQINGGPGSIVTIGDKTYAFKPEDESDKDGITPHVAEVTDLEHIARFKEIGCHVASGIAHGYRPAPNAKWPKNLPESTIGKEEETDLDPDDDPDFGKDVSDDPAKKD